MIGYADHLMANAVYPSEAPEAHPSVVSMLDDGFCSTLDGKCSSPCEAPKVHPSVVCDIR